MSNPSIHLVFQRLAGLESNHLAGTNLDGLAGRRDPARSGHCSMSACPVGNRQNSCRRGLKFAFTDLCSMVEPIATRGGFMRNHCAMRLGDIQVYTVAASALLVGGLIYLLLRQEPVPALRWMTPDQLQPSLQEFRHAMATFRSATPAWIFFSLPDGLWSFAYAASMSRLWAHHPGAAKLFWLLSIPILGIGFEVGQWLRLIPGYFNVTDLIVATLGASLGFWIGYSRLQEITTDTRCSS